MLTKKKISGFLRQAIVLVLLCSELPIAIFMAHAINESTHMILTLFGFSLGLWHETILTTIGYCLAFGYALSALLSVGNLKESLSKIRHSHQSLRLYSPLLLLHYIAIYLSFVIGSAAAALGIIELSQTSLMLLVATIILLGQIFIVMLQANERVFTSSISIKQYYQSTNKVTMLKKLIKSKAGRIAIYRSACNILFWSVFFFYIAHKLTDYAQLNEQFAILLCYLSMFIGAYFTFALQSLSELNQVFLAANKIEKITEPSTSGQLLLTMAFITRFLITISFFYTVLCHQAYDYSNLNSLTTIWAIALAICFGLPSSSQYIAYIHDQVHQGVDAISTRFFLIRSIKEN